MHPEINTTLQKRFTRSPEPVHRIVSPQRINSSPQHYYSANHKSFPQRTTTNASISKINETYSNPSSRFSQPHPHPNFQNLQYYQNIQVNSPSPVKNSITTNTKNISTRVLEQEHTPTPKPRLSSDIRNIRVIESVEMHKKQSRPEFEHSPIVSESTVINHSPIMIRNYQDVKASAASFPSNPSNTQNPQVVETKLSTHDQYILQLLNEAKELKSMIQRLMQDNTKLMMENRNYKVFRSNEEELGELRKLLKYYENENSQLKREVEVKRSRNVGGTENDSELEHYNRIISALEKQVTHSKNTFEKHQNIAEESEKRDIINQNIINQLQKTIAIKDKQIAYFQEENQALAVKMRELLQEMHHMQLRFQSQKLHLFEQSEAFKHSAHEEINRLRSLTRMGLEQKPHELLETYLHKYQTQHHQYQEQPQEQISEHLQEHVQQHTKEYYMEHQNINQYLIAE